MEDVIYCPLLHCQSPVIVDGESDFAQCPTCSYAFCPYCKLSYHGVSKCKIASRMLVLINLLQLEQCNVNHRSLFDVCYDAQILVYFEIKKRYCRNTSAMPLIQLITEYC